MTSNERRSGSAVREYAIGAATGAIFGATNTIVGHPFDTIKTKMQAQTGFGGTVRETVRQIYVTEGLRGFYRGCIPPMWGSAVYRGAQFAVYNELYTKLGTRPEMREYIDPFGVGSEMEVRVLLAGAVGATARTVLESPIEYCKVKGQTGQAWKMGEVYQGAHLQWLRTGPMMTFYFCSFDMCKRNGYTNTLFGQFLSSGGCALVGFWIVWPFETLKNLAQAGVKGSIVEQVRRMPGGVFGLYRGIGPGSASVFLRNGAAMMVMQTVNRKITEWGLRD